MDPIDGQTTGGLKEPHGFNAVNFVGVNPCIFSENQ